MGYLASLGRALAGRSGPAVEVKTFTAETIAALTLVSRPGRVGRDYLSLARQGYELNFAVGRAIAEIAAGAASVPLDVFVGDREAPDHEVARLLRRPNWRQSRATFVRDALSYYLLDGNLFVEAVTIPTRREPTALWPLRPDRVAVERLRVGPIGETVYRYEGGSDTSEVRGFNRTYRVPDIEERRPIMQMSTFNPRSDLRGLPPLVSGRSSIDRHNLAEEWNSNLIRNGDGAAGLLTVREGKDGVAVLDDATRERVIAELEQNWSGARNAGRPRLLEGNLEYQKTTMTPAEMEWSAANNTALRAVCNALGYPPFLLGIPGDNTYSNQREARAALWENTIVPLVVMFAEELATWLAPHFDEPDLRLVLNLDSVTALSLRREQAWERVKNSEFISTNEKREELGFPERPEPEADEILVPATATPLALAVEPPEPPPAPAPEATPEEERAALARLAEKLAYGNGR